MFYRFTNDGRQKTCDLRDAYGGALVLCGGHPSLRDEPLELLAQPGVVTMAMNNTALLFRPNLWVCADHASCYAPSILHDGGIVKFARLLYWNERLAGGEPWHTMPGTLFYGVDDAAFRSDNLLDDYPFFAWWKNVFIVALQLAWHLGFRRVYLAGTGFNVPSDRHYAFDQQLSPAQSDYSRRTYVDVVAQVRAALPHFAQRGFSLVSCTPGSALNDVLPFLPLRDAVTEALADFPKRDASGLKHAADLVVGK
jgi:hypothetical protein